MNFLTELLQQSSHVHWSCMTFRMVAYMSGWYSKNSHSIKVPVIIILYGLNADGESFGILPFSEKQ